MRLRIAVLVYPAILAGCVSYTVRTLDFRQAFLAGRPADALQYLESQRANRLDRALYELNKGMLLHMSGDFAGSNTFLEQAKQRMQELAATSISENLTAVTINEATRSYAGQTYEQLAVYSYKALNYLLLNQPDAARVEVLQADVRMREWESAGEISAFEASAFMQYLSGLVFEMVREWDDALIAYRKAYDVYIKAGGGVPLQLQRDLLRLTEFRGRKSEHQQYRKSFSVKDWESMKARKSKAELVVFIHQGAVSALQEQLIFNYSPELKHQIQIALPYYPLRSEYMPQANIQIDGEMLQSEILENIDALARRNLDSRMAGITLRAMARTVLKKKMSQEVGKDNGFAGFMVNVAGLVTERADTRSWISLPESIQLVRVSLPPGEHAITVGGRPLPLLSLTTGQTTVISIHDTGGGGAYAVH